MNMKNILLILMLAASSSLFAQTEANSDSPSFENASQTLARQLEESLDELEQLREQLADEKIPLSRKLGDLESELAAVRIEYNEVTRLRDNRILGLTHLREDMKARKEEVLYLSNLFGEFTRNFQDRLHICELHRYEKPVETARLASENSNLTQQEVYKAQVDLLNVSLDRLEDALGASSFKGSAVAENGLVKEGTFVLVGPAAIFRSEDGSDIGTAEQRLGSLEPAIISFGMPEDTTAAQALATSGTGMFPLDPTLGSAHKIESTQQTLAEHIQKGGPVMYPILGIAAIALLVALYRWLELVSIRKPSQKKLNELMTAVAAKDIDLARKHVSAISGPVGKMLSAGVEHLREPRELIEEVMYETVLAARLRLQRLLPIIAITAAASPLLGLLGTVTGIINTFKLIEVFGAGDVKSLSGGISEALITTKFGLIVAIPSLLLHAYLSRKAKAVVDDMDKAAVTLINNVSKSNQQNDAA